MRSLRRVLLLGSLVLTGLWFLREPAPAVASKSHETTGAFSTLPLIAACLAIVLATILWLAIQGWNEASEHDATARAMTDGNPAQAATLMTSEHDATARAMTDGNPAQAATLMIRYGCAGCHTIPGVPGADGQVGGALSDVRKRVFIAGVLPNTAKNLIDWIVEPQLHDPHSAMPVTGITRSEARDVAAWLYSR